MNAELQAIRDAMEDPATRDRETARNLSLAYIDAHPDEFTELADKTFEEVVRDVEVFRETGYDTFWWRAEAWLLKLFPSPQTIGGELQIGVPVPPQEGGE